MENEDVKKYAVTEARKMDSSNMTTFMCLGIALGMLFGGIFFHNMIMGVCIGICLGIAVGGGLDACEGRRAKSDMNDAAEHSVQG